MGSDPDKERSPPPAPTPLDFPVYRLPDVPETASESSLRGMHGVLASIRRPQDITPHKFKDLNLKVESGVSAADIVLHDGATSAPPLPWEVSSSDPSVGQQQPVSGDDGGRSDPVFMGNGNAYPTKEKFEALQAELLYENDDAFREISRLPPRPGKQRIRVSQARKFWTGLERMSQYWDCSMDEYFERPKTPEPARAPVEGGSGDKMQTDHDNANAHGQLAATPMDVDNQPVSAAVGDSTEAASTADGKHEPEAQAQAQETVEKYRGRRIATGRDMPDDLREETIRALTEMAAWPFGCQASLPIVPPRLAVGSLLFPVRQTFEAARSPKDRALARNGLLEGPVFVAQCRSETSFRGPDDIPGFGIGETCDVVREVGSMLLTAQERAREGTTEVRPGEGKWWTSVARWGGAPNDAIGDSSKVSNGEEKQQPGGGTSAGGDRKRSKHDHPLLSSRRPGGSRKMTNSEKWKIVQPGPSLWDRRLRYQQIGKCKDSPFDDIYMLSSINHHLAILHLRVHRRYLEVLTTGTSSFPPDSDPDHPWHVLELRRTRWYDLFDAQDRLEVFRGIWTLFHFLLRRM